MTVVLIATVWTAADSGPVGRGLAWAPLVWIGTISYGIYLWHWPVYLWLGAREPHASALRRAVAIVVTIAIAAASYHLVERPIRRGGARGSGGNLQRWLARPRNVLLAMPLALGFVACASLQATTVPAVTDATLVIMMTGDSVPKQDHPGARGRDGEPGLAVHRRHRGRLPGDRRGTRRSERRRMDHGV